ncbi:MAG: hypothetical protein E5V62_19935 [Mesorhizobium sp.]|nr:hypothetical protein EN751_16420 [Mesorhizobium sp. M4A.F.Ca.ET.029.04.2.1]TIW33555.1 MAG: hypothetical protein E5V62_19935 [Mesorhizobium sp.]
MESPNRSNYLFLRNSGRKTVTHFSWNCPKARRARNGPWDALRCGFHACQTAARFWVTCIKRGLRRLYPQKARATGPNRWRGLAFAGFFLSV